MAGHPLFRTVLLNSERLGSVSLTELGQEAAAALKAAGQTVSVFESTTAGLVQASLQSQPGASSFTTCGAVSYSKQKAHAVLGGEVLLPSAKPENGEGYKDSKRTWTETLARLKRKEVGSTWCLCESGACGPTFTFPEITTGFTAIFVSGPIERGVFLESGHNDREANMWSYTKAALQLLADCVKDAQAQQAQQAQEMPKAPLLTAKEDRYGGVEAVAEVGPVGAFDAELRQGLQGWKSAGKKGIWLKIPLPAAACVGSAVAQGFRFHHAQEDYVMMTQWLPDSPSPLPRYAFTQVGVGGIVVNSKDEILLVQERVSPAETVLREVQEETGIKGELDGVVSLRHSHNFRFGQDDIFVSVKVKATTESICIDPNELRDARWMSEAEIKELLADSTASSLDGKVPSNQWKVIEKALHGSMIEGTALPNSRGGKMSMLYTGPALK
ncbi:unnamed protein product [Cladocopium goreaui]|uniref:Nudix hydrolase 8 (AtNUDT8) n=1 Tax=Cladocopium goreaui TaxID=2562237 RepID=A0A9P1FZF8_9DINO|nr:unnamed protein product [Cladocopium goreaui]